MVKHKAVYVEWLDHCSANEWSKANEHSELMVCRSVGWLISENKDCLVLALSHDSNEHSNYAPVMIIGKKLIKKKKTLRL